MSTLQSSPGRVLSGDRVVILDHSVYHGLLGYVETNRDNESIVVLIDAIGELWIGPAKALAVVGRAMAASRNTES